LDGSDGFGRGCVLGVVGQMGHAGVVTAQVLGRWVLPWKSGFVI